MPITIALMSDSDFYRAFELISTAFGTGDPFLNEFWPAHSTDEGRTNGALRLKAMDADPNTVFLKAIDTELIDEANGKGKMVGMAKWTFYKDSTMPTPVKIIDGPWWDDGKGDKRYAELLADAFFARRMKAIADSGGNLAILDYLAVDPEYQCQGAGSMLVKWGVDKVDEYNLGGVIEATAKGARVYQKFGFKPMEFCSFAVPEPYAHLPREEVMWMERTRRDGYMWDGRKTTTSNWLAEP